MDSARYRAFLTAAEAGSFAKAAERLHYTPSGVSQLVTALEKEMGFPLLRRSKKGVEVTADGARLIPAMRELLRQEEQIFALAAEVNGLLLGSLTIATYPSIASHWLPSVIWAFRREHPNIEIRLMEGIRQELVQWLEERKADMAFMSYQEPMPYDWLPLAEDRVMALLPMDHPLAGAESYPLENCARDDFIMPALGRDEDLAEIFARNNVTPNIRFTTIENAAVIAMVEQGLGVSVMNGLITGNFNCNVAERPIAPPTQITLGVAVPSLEGASPAAKRFLHCAAWVLTKREDKTGGEKP